MLEPTKVTLTVPLQLPLSLVNAIEAESQRSHTSIPDMLSCMLVDAFDRQETLDASEAAANSILEGGPITTNGAPLSFGNALSPGGPSSL